MQKYRILDDVAIADICFEIYGQNLNMLFRNAAFALTDIMVNIKTLSVKQTKKLKISGDSLEDLFIKFMEEIIYLKDSEQFLVGRSSVHVVNKTPFRLTADLSGEAIDYKRHNLKTDVKAVTYHMFALIKLNKSWKARVVVDV